MEDYVTEGRVQQAYGVSERAENAAVTGALNATHCELSK